MGVVGLELKRSAWSLGQGGRMIAALIGALMVCGAVAVHPARSASGPAITYEFPETFTAPGEHSFTVPAGVSRVTVDAVGGAGGLVGADCGNKSGGRGASVTSSLQVSPGERLEVVVGGRGGDGCVGSRGGSGGIGGGAAGGANNRGSSEGAGGGGASTVSSHSGVLLVVAGGGGGAAAEARGGDAGGSGANAGSAKGGEAGTSSGGGGGGAGCLTDDRGTTGSRGKGGAGGFGADGGGGGGGGYFGGGGGGGGGPYPCCTEPAVAVAARASLHKARW